MVSLCLWHALEAERLKWSGKPLWTALFGLSPQQILHNSVKITIPNMIVERTFKERGLWRESLRKPSYQSLVDQRIWQFSTPVPEPAFCSGGESDMRKRRRLQYTYCWFSWQLMWRLEQIRSSRSLPRTWSRIFRCTSRISTCDTKMPSPIPASHSLLASHSRNYASRWVDQTSVIYSVVPNLPLWW